MNFSPLKFLSSLWGRVIFFVIAFLAVSGTGLYFYTHQESQLKFHQDWTETDRKQIQEILFFVNSLEKQDEDYRTKEYDKKISSFSIGRVKDWPALCESFYDYYRKKLAGNMYTRLRDTILKTSRTGNAAYIGENNYTLLQFACGFGKKELACHLIDKGADVNVRNMMEMGGNIEPGDAPINMLAGGFVSMDTETTIFLMEKLASRGADLNMKVGDVLYPFEMFCNKKHQYGKAGCERIILRLIDLGADVSSPLKAQGKARSAFMFPVKRGLGKVVRRLCEMGVDVNEGYDAQPPLFCLTLDTEPDDQLEIARALLDHGAQINTPLSPRNAGESRLTGKTPLIYLCTLINSRQKFDNKQKQGLLDLFSLYCERKADVNLTCEQGNTPLMYLFEKAEKDKNLEWTIALARILLDHGADPALKNSSGETVYDIIKMEEGTENEILEKLPALRPGK